MRPYLTNVFCSCSKITENNLPYTHFKIILGALFWQPFPDEEVPGFQTAITELFFATKPLYMRILEVVAVGLDLEVCFNPPPTQMHKGASSVFPFSRGRGYGGVASGRFPEKAREGRGGGGVSCNCQWFPIPEIGGISFPRDERVAQQKLWC